MSKSVAKIKDLVRSLGLEKDANRDLLEFIKHHEAVTLQLEQANQRVERVEKELFQSKSETQAALANGKTLEKQIHRMEQEFAQYRQEVETPSGKAVDVLKRQWEASMRADALEPDWSTPGLSRPPEGGFVLRSDGTIDIALGRLRLWQNNYQVGSPVWVMLNRNRRPCELLESGFVVCERNLPDWEVLHPDDRNKTVYAAYSLQKPIRLVAAYSRETVLARVAAGQFRGGRRVVVQISGKRNINVNLSTPLERLNPAYFTNRVCRADERAFIEKAADMGDS